MAGLLLHARVAADVEADDRRLAGGGGLHVRERHVAGAGGDDLERHLLALDVVERLDDRLEGALRIGLHDHAELALLVGVHLAEEVVERDRLRLRKLLFLAGLRGLFGERARALLVEHHAELRAGLGHAREARALDGRGGRRLADAAAVVVDEGAHLAEVLADEDRVAHLERAARDEQHRRGAEALLELGLHHVAVRAARRVGGELEDVRLEEDHLEELVHAVARDAGDGAAHDVAAPFLGGEALLLEHLLHALGVGGGLVALRDGHHDLHAGLAGELDRLLGLRHDAVVGGDDDHGDVRELRAALAHRVERGVAGRVEERDLAALHVHLVGGDLLRDAAGLARRHLRVADVVHERGLAVVDVAEERHDRRTRLHLLGLVLRNLVVGVDGLEDGLLVRGVAGVLDVHAVAVLLRDLRGHVRLHALVDRGEHLELHEVRDQAVRAHAQLERELLHHHGAADGDLARRDGKRDGRFLQRWRLGRTS